MTQMNVTDMRFETRPGQAESTSRSGSRSLCSRTLTKEVSMKLVMRVVAVLAVAVALAAGVVSGVALAGSNQGLHKQGLMPEVVVKAEMPRLVMDTVVVRGLKSVVMVPSDLGIQ